MAASRKEEFNEGALRVPVLNTFVMSARANILLTLRYETTRIIVVRACVYECVLFLF